ncbi:MAG: glycosyltransferase family 2 protein [Candidatus Kerfeldbacteria bacterium]
MKPHISVVVPYLNEEESLNELYQKLIASLEPLGAFEIVFVDDGSTDRSYEIVRELFKKDHRVRAVKFRRNLGKSAALSEGFRVVRGEIVVMIDADLQDEPSEIPRLLSALNHNDLVTGWKENRNDPWTKTFPSAVFNGFARLLFKTKLHDMNCGLKVMRADVARSIDLYGELHRFIPILAHIQGFSVSELPVEHHERRHGVSKYGWKRFIRGSFDLITVAFLGRFQNSPLYLFGAFGGLSVFLGVGIGLYLTVLRLQGQSIGTRPLLTFAVLLIIAGMQLLFTGLLAELIVSRTHQRRYPVEEELDHDRPVSEQR